MGRSKMSLLQAMRCILPLSLLLLLAAACAAEPERVAVPNVPATVQAEVANQLASIPTATPWPTHTPYPTATAYPTATPYPTGTPLPTASPYPTATPYPTYTPYPTPTPAAAPTPLPTYTPYPTPTRAPVIVQQVAPTAAPAGPTRPPFDTYAERDSGERADQILRTSVLGGANCDPIAELSMELSRQQDVAILKVYDMRIVVSNSTRVECAGTARWSRGEDTPIYVFVESDREVEDEGNFYGYRFPYRGYD